MVAHAKVTDNLEWGTIEHLVKRQIPLLLLQLTEKASDLDEQDGDEVWVTREFLADVANAIDAAQEQLRAIRPYLREAISVEAVARYGRESLWETLPEQAKQRHLEAARDVIAAAGFTPVASATVRESGWQPIATAPKDGTLIMLWNEAATEPLLGRFMDGYWRNNHYGNREAYWHCKPVWWMPLAEPPQEQGRRGSDD
jgi:hypothetical protein